MKINNNSNYNWYPGHMKKALDNIEDTIKKVDCVFMVIDARTYKSGYNEKIHQTIRENRKQPVVILSREDLIPKSFDKKRMVSFFEDKGLPCYFVDNVNGKLKQLLEPIRVSKMLVNKRFNNVTDFRPTIMIVGMPNSGKSTFINSLKRKASATTANIPGVTKRMSLFGVRNLATMLDTPGVLVPDKLDDERAYPLHLVRSIKKERIPTIKSVHWALELIYSESIKNYNNLAMKFSLTMNVVPDWRELEDMLGPIKVNQLYTLLSNVYPFVWDL